MSPKDPNQPACWVERLMPGDDHRVMEASALFDRSPDPAAVQRFLEREDHHLLLAHVGDAAVGFALAHELPRLDGERPKLLLYEIGTSPSFRRQGVGRRLIDSMKAVGRRRGARSVFAITSQDNAAAMALFLATGAVRKSTREAVVEYTL